MLTAISVEDYADIVGHGSRMRVRRQIVPWLLRRSPHTAPVLLVSALENLFHKLPERAPAFARKGEELRDRLADLLGSDGVILHPTYSRPAPRHRTPMLTPLDFVCTSLYSLFGFPVTQVPVGVDARGLPVGVQVVGAPGNDHLTLAVAAEIERRWPRRDTPPIDPAR
jgi:fatty acid amide hydrolase 2